MPEASTSSQRQAGSWERVGGSTARGSVVEMNFGIHGGGGVCHA